MIKRIETDLLEIAYKEYGDSSDIPVILLHGFPYDINAYNESSDILSQKGFRVLTPYFVVLVKLNLKIFQQYVQGNKLQ